MFRRPLLGATNDVDRGGSMRRALMPSRISDSPTAARKRWRNREIDPTALAMLAAPRLRATPQQLCDCLEIEQPHEEVVPLHVDTTTDPAKRDAVVTRRRPSRSLQVDGAEAGELFK